MFYWGSTITKCLIVIKGLRNQCRQRQKWKEDSEPVWMKKNNLKEINRDIWRRSLLKICPVVCKEGFPKETLSTLTLCYIILPMFLKLDLLLQGKPEGVLSLFFRGTGYKRRDCSEVIVTLLLNEWKDDRLAHNEPPINGSYLRVLSSLLVLFLLPSFFLLYP